MLLPRYYQKLDDYLKEGKVLVIYGPRQIGKTTLLKNFLKDTSLKYKLDNGENIKVQEIISSQNFDVMLDYVAGLELYVIDEAQRIPNVGLGLKILVDQRPDLRIIVTGSSSLELSGQVGEPLVGRKRNLILYPMSQMELSKLYSPAELGWKLSQWLIYGGYPVVVAASTNREKAELLGEIANSYMLKDILELENVKSPKVLMNLLKLLAFQVGSEVSNHELAVQLEIDTKTVARYLDLLEKTFILYNLRGFSRNLRKEVTKTSKYYFWDTGLRNAIISNFNDLNTRDDVGKLWENFIVIERLKKQAYVPIYANNYFWRTWDQKEIDWVEMRDGKLLGYEISYQPKEKSKAKKEWLATYSEAELDFVNKENYLKFIT